MSLILEVHEVLEVHEGANPRFSVYLFRKAHTLYICVSG